MSARGKTAGADRVGVTGRASSPGGEEQRGQPESVEVNEERDERLDVRGW